MKGEGGKIGETSGGEEGHIAHMVLDSQWEFTKDPREPKLWVL